MKKYVAMIALLLMCAGVQAESAKRILDKAAATVSNPGGVKAHFQMISKQFGSTNGEIAVKGNKFHATTPDATIWFDGKTQWTYMKGNDEVNISNPTEAQLQAINPYNFINIYKKGFKLSAKEVNNSYEVHLVPSKKEQKIQEMYIIVDKSSYHPTHVKMKQKDKWSTIIISDLKTATLNDDLFQFNSKDFPKAEIIDLR
ncbi:MAG: outer-membrane lipoprotein carrier protein LolA [Prevotella sp.]|nr:outer-membrane lipoprotein carrier protein LolA [Prevotella sp.]